MSMIPFDPLNAVKDMDMLLNLMITLLVIFCVACTPPPGVENQAESRTTATYVDENDTDADAVDVDNEDVSIDLDDARNDAEASVELRENLSEGQITFNVSSAYKADELTCSYFTAIDVLTGQKIIDNHLHNRSPNNSTIAASLERRTHNLDPYLECQERGETFSVRGNRVEIDASNDGWSASIQFIRENQDSRGAVDLALCFEVSLGLVYPQTSILGQFSDLSVGVITRNFDENCTFECSLTFNDESRDITIFDTNQELRFALPSEAGRYEVILECALPNNDEISIIDSMFIDVIDDVPEPPIVIEEEAIECGINSNFEDIAIECLEVDSSMMKLDFSLNLEDIVAFNLRISADPELLDLIGSTASTHLLELNLPMQSSTATPGVLSIIVQPDLIAGAQLVELGVGKLFQIEAMPLTDELPFTFTVEVTGSLITSTFDEHPVNFSFEINLN